MVSVFVRQSLVQIVTPDAMRGRVSAVSSLFIGASNELGEFESGGMARLLGPVGSAMFGGCGAILVTLLWAGLFRPCARPTGWNRLTGAHVRSAVADAVEGPLTAVMRASDYRQENV